MSMLRRGLVKCLSLIFIVFLMYVTSASARRILPIVDLFTTKMPSFDPIFDCCSRFPDPVSLSAVEDEPGFDLTDAEIRKFKLWPKGIIPYYIDAVSFNDKVLRDRIRSYLNSVNDNTRLSFLELPTPPKDDETRWVFFANRRGQLGCGDHSILNFTNEGVQHVNLGYDCLSTGGELAEAVLAIAGVPHQHNAPNRDEYITVMEENIMPEKKYLFRKLKNDEWLFHDIEYDITSASQYHHHKHSINGKPTIVFAVAMLPLLSTTNNKIKMMGESHGFSTVDVEKIRMLYNYIVKKKENKVPECDKLFRKGRNFQNERPLDLPDPKEPRKKPSKYLGLSEQINDYEQESGDKLHQHELVEQAGEKVVFSNEISDEQLNSAATRKMNLKSRPTKLKFKSNNIGRRRKASGKNTTLKAHIGLFG